MNLPAGPFDLPRELLLGWWTVMGLFVGSFLNVAIHRLPRPGMSVARPRRSLCPSCGKTLTWRENVPLLSWLVQRGRCRGCGWRIPWRYPLVEVLTAALWLEAARRTGEGEYGLLLVRLAVLSGLVVATFVDFACFEIPDEVSIGGMVLAPLASLLVPALHEATWVAEQISPRMGVDRAGALVGCLSGMAVGGGSLLGIGWIGRKLYGREAMGLGDVKLLAAGGGFVGPGGVVLALMAASVGASVVGVLNLARLLCVSRRRTRARGGSKRFGRSLACARVAGRYLPFGPYLALGIAAALLYWETIARLL